MTIGRAWYNSAFQYLLDHSDPFAFEPVRDFFHNMLPRLDRDFLPNINEFRQISLDDVIQANSPYSEGILTAIATSFIACSIVAFLFFALFIYFGTLGRKKWSREEYLQMVDPQRGARKIWGKRTCHLLMSFLIIIMSAASMIISDRLTSELDNAATKSLKFSENLKLASTDIDHISTYTSRVENSIQTVLDDTPSNNFIQFNATLSSLFASISDYVNDINDIYTINPIGQIPNVLSESIVFKEEENSNFLLMLRSLADITYLSNAVLIGLLFLSFVTLCHTRLCATCRRGTSILDVLVFSAVGLLSALTLGASMITSDFCDNPGAHWISLINNAGPYAVGPKVTYSSAIDPSSPITNPTVYHHQKISTATTLAYYGICAVAKGSGKFSPETFKHPYASWTWGTPVTGLDDIYAINTKLNYNMHPFDISPKINTGTYAAAEAMTSSSQLHSNSITLYGAVLNNATLAWAEPSTKILMQQSNSLNHYTSNISKQLSLSSVCPVVNDSLHSICNEGLGYITLLWSISIVILVLFFGLLIATAQLCAFHPGDASLARAVVPVALLPGEKLDDANRASALIVAMGLTPLHKRKKQKVQANVVLETSTMLSPGRDNEASWN